MFPLQSDWYVIKLPRVLAGIQVPNWVPDEPEGKVQRLVTKFQQSIELPVRSYCIPFYPE